MKHILILFISSLIMHNGLFAMNYTNFYLQEINTKTAGQLKGVQQLVQLIFEQKNSIDKLTKKINNLEELMHKLLQQQTNNCAASYSRPSTFSPTATAASTFAYASKSNTAKKKTASQTMVKAAKKPTILRSATTASITSSAAAISNVDEKHSAELVQNATGPKSATQLLDEYEMRIEQYGQQEASRWFEEQTNK